MLIQGFSRPEDAVVAILILAPILAPKCMNLPDVLLVAVSISWENAVTSRPLTSMARSAMLIQRCIVLEDAAAPILADEHVTIIDVSIP